MLKAIIRFSLRFRGAIYALAILLASYGLYNLTLTKLDVFPEFAPPMAMVQTEAPGLSSEQVELLITQPTERQLSGTVGVQMLRSKSLQGLSVITVVFDDRTDVFQARQRVTERLNNLGAAWPAGVKQPQLLPLTTSTSTVLMIGLTSKTQSLMEIHDLAEWTLKPQLMSVPGVAEAILFGGETREIQVQIDPAKLISYDLTMQDVINATQQATGIRGAGFIETANQRITLQTEGQNTTPDALAKVILRWSSGAGIQLGDVAKVTYASAPLVGAASVKGTPGVILVLESQYGSNTLAVTQNLEKTLAALKPVLAKQGVELYADIFRPANFITQATSHLRSALLAGGILVVAILFLFLMNARTAAISAIAIPLSLLTAIIVLNFLGVTLNTMTLGGLAIALGEVVDDAIIDVENIYRRLRENQRLQAPLPALRVVLRAALEVRSAVVFATFIVILIFLPVLSLSGVAGKLFAPLGTAYILAVLASLGVALTLTPAMALGLLAKQSHAQHEPSWVATLKQRYQHLLAKIELHSRSLMFVTAFFCLAALALLPFLRGNFIPELREGHFIAHIGLAPGSSLTETMRIGTQISHELMRIPGIRLVSQTAGRASEVVDPAGVHISELDIDLEPMNASHQEAILQKINALLANFPGVSTSVNTFLVERIDETISGTAAPIVIKVFGENLDVIDREAQAIAHLVGAIQGAANVHLEASAGIPELSIRLKPEQLTHWGFQPLEVLNTIQNAYQGIALAQVFEANRSYDVRLKLAPQLNADPQKIGELLLRNPDGQMIPLRELASITQAAGRYQIAHQDGLRMQTISVTLGARAVDDFVREAQARIARDIVMPKGTYLVFSGENEARKQSQRDLFMHGSLALISIMVLLSFALKSRRSLALVMMNLPFALVGGVFSVALTHADLSLGAMVGFVTLFGISLRNSIMLMSHYEYLIHVENAPWNLTTAVRGASERLVPILMTALVTALALLPLALTSGAAGNEIEGSMAIVILGGLITSTLLNLIVLPTLALRFAKFNQDA